MTFWKDFASHHVFPSATLRIAFCSSLIDALCSTNPTAPPFSPARSISSRSSRVSSRTGAKREYSRISSSSASAPFANVPASTNTASTGKLALSQGTVPLESVMDRPRPERRDLNADRKTGESSTKLTRTLLTRAPARLGIVLSVLKLNFRRRIYLPVLTMSTPKLINGDNPLNDTFA